MFKTHDKFLPEKTFSGLQDYCKADFQKVTVGEKEFSILRTPDYIFPLIQQPGHEIILTFIREAHAGFDNDLRIHADGVIAGQKADRAAVLYINQPDGVTPNGTAFWKHTSHGKQLPPDCTEEEFNRLLTEDANDPEKWEQVDFVEAKPNRLLTYSANLFHSKFPSQIQEGTRIVLVVFYKKINGDE